MPRFNSNSHPMSPCPIILVHYVKPTITRLLWLLLGGKHTEKESGREQLLTNPFQLCCICGFFSNDIGNDRSYSVKQLFHLFSMSQQFVSCLSDQKNICVYTKMTSKHVPFTISCTRTSQKKVTHVVNIQGAELFCTSAQHVCEVLDNAGIHTTPAIVYRACSTCEKRVHKRTIPFPEGVSVGRVLKVAPAPCEQP